MTPEWVAEILDRWIPPEEYDARMAAVVDGYIADQHKEETRGRRADTLPQG